jgi:hypothetical protein
MQPINVPKRNTSDEDNSKLGICLYTKLLLMNFKTFFLFSAMLLSTGVLAQEKPVKMSNSGICHAPNTTYYEQTKNFTRYKTLDECLKAGGRMPKK